MKGVILYTKLNIYSVRNHFMAMHPCEHNTFTRFYNGKIWREREDTFMGQGSNKRMRKVEDSDPSISCVSDFMITTKKYNKGHTQQA